MDFEERHDNEQRHMVHVHTWNSLSEVADNHQHVTIGVTAPARTLSTSHVHRLHGRTTFYVEGSGSHWHWFDTVTGPAIPLPDGTHVHYFNGPTSVDDGHAHIVFGATGIGPAGYVDDGDDCDDPPFFKPKHREEEEVL